MKKKYIFHNLMISEIGMSYHYHALYNQPMKSSRVTIYTVNGIITHVLKTWIFLFCWKKHTAVMRASCYFKDNLWNHIYIYIFSLVILIQESTKFHIVTQNVSIL